MIDALSRVPTTTTLIFKDLLSCCLRQCLLSKACSSPCAYMSFVRLIQCVYSSVRLHQSSNRESPVIKLLFTSSHFNDINKQQWRLVTLCSVLFPVFHPLMTMLIIPTTTIVGLQYITQGRQSLWDRGDTSPQYLDWGDTITNVPPNISRVISYFYPCNILLIS